MIIVYGIPNCDTVKKARAWLTGRGITHEFYDFKQRGVPVERLADWAEAAGWDKLLNRQGTTWRKLAPVAQASANDAAGAQALAVANPSVIKRPVVEWQGPQGPITVGFDALAWDKLSEK